jgi:hypothetical protein
MARSAISNLAQSLRRHCTARPVGAALLALGLGAVIAGGALAISPTVDTALVFRGGVNIVTSAASGSDVHVYTVPAGRKFMLTDLVISNNNETSPATIQRVITGSGTNCDWVADRTAALSIPVASTLHLPFVTGIGFTSGQHVCIQNAEGPGGNTTSWTIRGYLFE